MKEYISIKDYSNGISPLQKAKGVRTEFSTGLLERVQKKVEVGLYGEFGNPWCPGLDPSEDNKRAFTIDESNIAVKILEVHPTDKEGELMIKFTPSGPSSDKVQELLDTNVVELGLRGFIFFDHKHDCYRLEQVVTFDLINKLT